jgi:hypothetical protein
MVDLQDGVQAEALTEANRSKRDAIYVTLFV